jgi:hypothetical protein
MIQTTKRAFTAEELESYQKKGVYVPAWTMPKENKQFIPPRGWHYVQIGVNFVKQPIVHLRGKGLKRLNNYKAKLAKQ